MSKIALTGHTGNLGSKIQEILAARGHTIGGFSKSSGTDLRDYSQVGSMIKSIKHFDWFINCAHPDYCQTQIVYRLLDQGFDGKILSIGSSVVHKNPGWTDLKLIEYISQKTALWHAHQSLSPLYPDKLWLWEPSHTGDIHQLTDYLIKLGL